MNARTFAPMNVTPLLTLEELGLDRRVTVEEASMGLARAAEAEIVRWVQFPAGVLFFTLVSGPGVRGFIRTRPQDRRFLLAQFRGPEVGRVQR
jgi:hypothetical protein